MAHEPELDRYDRMTYRRCGRSGLVLPAVTLGLWQNFGAAQPEVIVRAMLTRAVDLGITHFDLANNYGPPPGHAEEVFGRALATDLAGLRDELVISTKAGYDMWPGPYGAGGSRKYLLARERRPTSASRRTRRPRPARLRRCCARWARRC